MSLSSSHLNPVVILRQFFTVLSSVVRVLVRGGSKCVLLMLMILCLGTAGAQAQIPPTLTANGSSAPSTVAPGASVTVGVQNGPGNATDWIGLDQTGTGDGAYLNWFYLNGTKTIHAD